MPDAIALIGGETLMGRELRELLAASPLGENVRMIAAEDNQSGVLSDLHSDPILLTALDATSLKGAGAVVLAGTPESTQHALRVNSGAPLVDLTHATEDHPHARLRAPLVEPHDFRVPHDAVQVIAHPAAIALALLISRVHEHYPIAQSLVHVFEPASERGLPGIEELQKQTVNLLSFQPLPKKVFDSQLSFAMLARFGEEAHVRLEEVESRIERHLATLLAMNTVAPPMPSIRLLQAPVFHGHSFSVWFEFEDAAPSVEKLEELFRAEPFDLRDGASEPPNNVAIAGHGGVAIGAISPDRNRPNALWLWMASDNVRLAAENALAVVREVI